MNQAKQKILVVDDEKDLRNVIKDILCDAGYDVILAENGNEGLGLARTVVPDLILCDEVTSALDTVVAARIPNP